MKPSLHFFFIHQNKFSVAYLLAMLEQSGMKEEFAIDFFRDFDEAGKIMRRHEFGRGPEIFVFSFMTPVLPALVELIEKIRSSAEYLRDPEAVMMIAGGPHVSGDPGTGVAMGFDLVFSGEGEYMWPEFLKKAAGTARHGFVSSLRSSYGATVVTDGRVPELSMFDQFTSIIDHMPPLEVMRGCYYKCRFCQTACSKVRFRPVEACMPYFREYRKRRYKRILFICPSAFHYMSPNVRTVNFGAVEELLAAAREHGADYVEFGLFPSETRPETITRESVALISKYCSNKKMSVGVQTGDEKRLRAIGRGHGLGPVYDACSVLAEFGITPIVDFIFGFPEETEDEQLSTLEVIGDLHARFGARVQTHFFTPLPGTPYYGGRFAPIRPRALEKLEAFGRDGICNNCYESGIKLSEKVCSILDGLAEGRFRGPRA